VRSMSRRCLLAGLLTFLIASPNLADEPLQPIRVAVYDDTGVGRSLKDLVVVLDRSDELEYDRLKAADIRGGKLADYDVLIHPGGSGSKQSKGLEEAGLQQVRTFVEAGGGYVGICAGAYLASNHYAWSLNILDAKVIDTAHWARGHGDVQIRLTEEGKRLFACDELETILYYQGPLLGPAEDDDVPDYTLLATFDTEIAKNGAPEGVMKGTAAIASGTFGKGRVLCFSPHPEKTRAVNRFVGVAIRWVAGSER
jgi:glutamine amidotransferase-like uncharacterized protein